MSKKLKVARVVTIPFFLDNQLRHQIKYLVDNGLDVTAVASSTGDWSRLQAIDGLACMPIDIARAPSPIKDLISLVRLYRLFKKESFDIVHSATPKAGLLCAIAGRCANIPIRLHTFTGQIWVNKKGFSRWLFRSIDRLILKLNTQSYADSEGQKQYLLSEGIGSDQSIKVIGSGSLAGVDMNRFNCHHWKDDKADVLAGLGIKDNDFVVTFIGRLAQDKGIVELVAAFNELQKKYESFHLILIGPCEEKGIEGKLSAWKKISRLHYIGASTEPEKYLAISNLLCLPSSREGFGTVVIEAAAMKVPTLGSNIYGLTDAIQANLTGVLVEPKSEKLLYDALEKLVTDKEYCKSLGEKAFKRCENKFDSSIVSELLKYEYYSLTN